MGKFEEQAAQAPPLERKEETGGYFILANKDLVNASSAAYDTAVTRSVSRGLR